MSETRPKIERVAAAPPLEVFRAALDASPHGLMLRSADAILYRNAAWDVLDNAAADAAEARSIHRSQYGFEFRGQPVEVNIAQDVTERRRMEAQLREAQRLEALGRWVGGVVHDFNNLLTAVMLYSDLIAQHLVPGSAPAGYNEEVRQAVKRGADLIGQLLSFARQQHAEPEVFSLNSLLRSLREVLRRMTGEDVEIVYELAEAPCNVHVAATRMEQVVFNLLLNARDAVSSGGTISVRTEERVVEGIADVALVVSDDGCGMDRETLAHVFEPFFSTKPEGKGTGLGLTTVHSIVTQCGGRICIDSELGRGTSVTVILPRAEVASKIEGASPMGTDIPRGSETVLLVEDDVAVRESVRRALSECGYDVKAAANGPEALAIAGELKRKPDLLIADVVLPGISGREVARRLRAGRASMATLFISGYDQSNGPAHDFENLVFLKPFSRESLARKVRQVLDCEQPGSGRHGG